MVEHPSSFHINGKQMKIKYLRSAPEELRQMYGKCHTEAAHVMGGIPPKIALPSSYLRLAPPAKKKVEFDRLVLSPALRLYRGRDDQRFTNVVAFCGDRRQYPILVHFNSRVDFKFWRKLLRRVTNTRCQTWGV